MKPTTVESNLLRDAEQVTNDAKYVNSQVNKYQTDIVIDNLATDY